MSEFKFTTEIASGLKPKGTNDFPLAKAEDILMPSGKRLSEEEFGGVTPTLNLIEAGFPSIPYGDKNGISLEVDTTSFTDMLLQGPVKFIFNIYLPDTDIELQALMSNVYVSASSTLICVYLAPIATDLDVAVFQITPTSVKAAIYSLIAEDSPTTAIDLSGFDSSGEIVETLENGRSETTLVEFDDSGNPTKITNPDGTVITLTW